VAQKSAALGGPGQAEEIERQARVQKREVGPVRVRRGGLDPIFAPDVAEDLAAVRRPGVAGGAPGGSDLVLVRPIGIDRDAVVGKDLAEDDPPIGAGSDAALRR
jgi:hypothetical protein